MATPAQADAGNIWIFGYGSLIHTPNFEHSRRVCGYIKGYRRVFWQLQRLQQQQRVGSGPSQEAAQLRGGWEAGSGEERGQQQQPGSNQEAGGEEQQQHLAKIPVSYEELGNAWCAVVKAANTWNGEGDMAAFKAQLDRIEAGQEVIKAEQRTIKAEQRKIKAGLYNMAARSHNSSSCADEQLQPLKAEEGPHQGLLPEEAGCAAFPATRTGLAGLTGEELSALEQFYGRRFGSDGARLGSRTLEFQGFIGPNDRAGNWIHNVHYE
ncbi:Cation transport regulator-like protein 1 [Tetrabaena socialis]|uniref:glutathione-specific gamma-glutamylcyclotransferase n=1 Tax=Tetrabaena socialis TaxID=47790 RepID=A0A2J8A439_9CHLO|nr:Cation transport regulator-like protein 1 [Tetrabaena socialis]|eukprot:PNH07273.1 Cation transport regulator-like protein 1 [Tetrabaena socialis]